MGQVLICVSDQTKQIAPWISVNKSLFWEGSSTLVSSNPSSFMEADGLFPCSQAPPPVLTLNQMRSIHTFQLSFQKTPFNTLPSSFRSSEWSVPFRLSNQNFVGISYLPMFNSASLLSERWVSSYINCLLAMFYLCYDMVLLDLH